MGADDTGAVWSLLRDAVIGLGLFARGGGEEAPYDLDRPDVERAWSDLKARLGGERWPESADATRRFLDAPPLAETSRAEVARALAGARALLARLGPNPRAARLMLRWLPAVALAIALVAAGRWVWRVAQNVATDAHVTVSSHNLRARDPSKLVRGEWTAFYAVITGWEPGAWVQLDLGVSKQVGTVVVYNRGDGSLEESLPLVVEVGDDPDRLEPVARCNDVFTIAQPFVANRIDRRARYVRLRRDQHGVLALARVEVYSANDFKP